MVSIILLILVAVAMPSKASSIEILVAIKPPNTTITLGEETLIPIIIQGSNEIAGGMVKIAFDPKIISIEEVVKGDYSKPVYKISTEGVVTIALALPQPPAKDNAVYAYLRVRAVGLGETEITILKAELNDEEGNLIYPKTINAKIKVVAPVETKTITETIVSTKTITFTKTTTIHEVSYSPVTITLPPKTTTITLTNTITITTTITKLKEPQQTLQLVIMLLAIALISIIVSIILLRYKK